MQVASDLQKLANTTSRLRVYNVSGCQQTTTQQMLTFAMANPGFKVMLGLYLNGPDSASQAVGAYLYVH
jgi:exo-beta-1,3-glucanase (GH17 family)